MYDTIQWTRNIFISYGLILDILIQVYNLYPPIDIQSNQINARVQINIFASGRAGGDVTPSIPFNQRARIIIPNIQIHFITCRVHTKW